MPAAYVKLILLAADTAGVTAVSVLAGTGLSAAHLQQSDQPVGFHETLRVLANAENLMGPGWHLQAAQQLTVPAHGPLGFAVVTAPDLRTSMDVLLRFLGTRAPFLWSAGVVEGDQFVLRFYETVEMGDQRRILVELAALSMQDLVERSLGREISGARLMLSYAEPSYCHALAQVLHAELVFGADRHSLIMPASWLEQPCALYDEAMHRYLVGRCEEELARGVGGQPVEVAVRQVLLARPGVLPGLAEVAASQHVSPRTLIRRLKDSGTSFQAILDDVRLTLASDLLANSDLGVSRIAWRLGYQDPSNFSRAFRRWLGLSPRDFRDQGLRS